MSYNPYIAIFYRAAERLLLLDRNTFTTFSEICTKLWNNVFHFPSWFPNCLQKFSNAIKSSVAKKWPKCDFELDFFSGAQNADFANCWQLITKNVIFTLKVSIKKTDWLSLLFVMVCETWLWYYWFVHSASFLKRYKKDWIQRPKTPILPIFGGQLRKIENFYLQNFNAKTDRLSFLFIMICETWPWYNQFGCGA